MAVATCYRCDGNAFLEQLGPSETAWVCIQCGSRRYVHHVAEGWPNDGGPRAFRSAPSRDRNRRRSYLSRRAT